MIKHCMFPVAGYGTRFLPATKAMPKEMLNVVNKPLIQYAVEEAYSAGIKEMAFVTGRGKHSIEDHFDVSFELEHQLKGSAKEASLEGVRSLTENCTFSYTRQLEKRGLGHAILSGRTLIGDNPFAVVLADDLCINLDGCSAIAQMVQKYTDPTCALIGVMCVEDSDVSNYGIIEPDRTKGCFVMDVKSMVEKPAIGQAPSNFASVGRYILPGDVFDILAELNPGVGGEIQLTDALNVLAQQGRLKAVLIKANRFDCGQVEGYIKATNFVYNNSEALL